MYMLISQVDADLQWHYRLLLLLLQCSNIYCLLCISMRSKKKLPVLFGSQQAIVSACEISAHSRDLQYLQQCVFGPLLLLSQVGWLCIHHKVQICSINQTSYHRLLMSLFGLIESFLMKQHCFCLTEVTLCLSTWLEVRSGSFVFKPREENSLRIDVRSYLCCPPPSPDYVQVVDMGTLELRITAVKPGTDGERVSHVLNYSNTLNITVKCILSYFKKKSQK